MTKSFSAADFHAAAAERTEDQPDDAREFRRLAVVELEAGAEDARQVADVLGDEEIALHQPLDAEHTGAIGKAEARGELGLHVKSQLLVGAAGEEVEVAADGPEKILGPLELAIFVGREHALADQFLAGLTR